MKPETGKGGRGKGEGMKPETGFLCFCIAVDGCTHDLFRFFTFFAIVTNIAISSFVSPRNHVSSSD